MRSIVRLACILTILILFDLTATIYWIANDLGVEANPTKKLQLRLADQNDLAGKVVERYKNKSKTLN